jgi:L-threonylcarbamoyladenylate synthase
VQPKSLTIIRPAASRSAQTSDNQPVPLQQNTEYLSATDPTQLLRAAEILRNDGTVAFPTETVYGLGANALSRAAVEKIFIAKQRPHWDPLIVHLADRTQLPLVTSLFSAPRNTLKLKFDHSELSERHLIEALIDRFWPGPLTLLLPRSAAIPDAVTAGRPLVGVRIPNHPVAQALLRAAAIPIAAPSANTFGHTSPTTAAHVLADLDGRIDAILDGGPTSVGLESTVAEVKSGEVILYRPGAVDQAMIEAVLGSAVWVHPCEPIHRNEAAPESLPSPGVGIRHYAPRARLILIDPSQKTQARTHVAEELQLVAAIDTLAANAERVGVMLPDGWNSSAADAVFRWGPWRQPGILAQRLYTGLRTLDDQGCTVILCPVPESPGISAAIRDRLEKAAR